jgi:hypothetical protein
MLAAFPAGLPAAQLNSLNVDTCVKPEFIPNGIRI